MKIKFFCALIVGVLIFQLACGDSVNLKRIHERWKKLKRTGKLVNQQQRLSVDDELYRFDYESNKAIPQFFDQIIDHNHPATSPRFKQRFYVNDEYFDASMNIVFIYVGGEAELRPTTVTRGTVVDLARSFGAMVISLEHRYYGVSHPFPTLTRDALEFLSSEQALMDLAHFISSYSNRDSRINSDTRWIVVGGSYPGNLSAWFRLKFPHLVIGSWASSAPVVAKADFWEYDFVVSDQLGDKCSTHVRKVTRYLEFVMNDKEKFKKLKTIFHPEMAEQVKDDVSFLYVLADIVAYTVQYDNPGVGLRDRLCDFKTLENNDNIMDSVNSFGNFTNFFFNIMNTSPKDMDMTSFTSEIISDPSENMRQWMWQCCKEFGYWQSAPIFNMTGIKPLRSIFITDKWHEDNICHGIFGLDKNHSVDTNRTNMLYGGTSIFKVSSNTIFTNGDRDPWKALGIQGNSAEDKKNVGYNMVLNQKKCKSWLIKDVGHCSDLRSSTATDPDDLITVRQHVEKEIKKWLK